MKLQIIIFILIANQAISQTFKSRELKTSIKGVTVFLQGANVGRIGKIDVLAGKSVLIVKSLSPHIDAKSIQVKAKGAFTILSVNHKFNYLNELKKDKKLDSLKQEIESLSLKIFKKKSRLEVLREKQSLLNENKKLGTSNSAISLTQLKQAIEFYDKEISLIKSEEINSKILITEFEQKRERIEKQIAAVSSQKNLPTSEIEIRIESAVKTKGEFDISYLVANAGWYPNYDVRVENIETPINLKYKADIYQNTGVDWEDVKLRFSNGNPNQSGVAPELSTWYLNYARNTIYNRVYREFTTNSIRNVSGKIVDDGGLPIPGANIVVKGTTVGTIADIDGNYSLVLPNNASSLVVSFIGFVSEELAITSSNMSVRLSPDVTQLSEVVVSGNGLQGRMAGVKIRGVSSLDKAAKNIITTTVENQTTVEFEVEKPYSIKSNGEKLSVDLKEYEIETVYEYYAVPKLDKDAFLIARIVNWDQYNLLEGEANLYFEDAYVGRSILDAKSLVDTLDISLGRDKNIVIGRTKIDNFSKRRTIGSNKVDSRGFEIIVRNKKSQAIKLILFDQLPVSAVSDIIVVPKELSGGKLDDRTGEITWEFSLQPQGQQKLTMEYDVKYPKKEKVDLE